MPRGDNTEAPLKLRREDAAAPGRHSKQQGQVLVGSAEPWILVTI
jgi:hypothetical protein